MYVYMYVYIYICSYTHIYIYTYAYTRIYIWNTLYVRMLCEQLLARKYSLDHVYSDGVVSYTWTYLNPMPYLSIKPQSLKLKPQALHARSQTPSPSPNLRTSSKPDVIPTPTYLQPRNPFVSGIMGGFHTQEHKQYKFCGLRADSEL